MRTLYASIGANNMVFLNAGVADCRTGLRAVHRLFIHEQAFMFCMTKADLDSDMAGAGEEQILQEKATRD